MTNQAHLPPTIRSLASAWLVFTWRVANAMAARAQRNFDEYADGIKDSCLDLGRQLPADPTTAELPGVDPAQLAAAMRVRVEATLREVADLLNEDDAGNWEAVTEERVRDCFARLADETLAAALDLRVARVEAQLPPERSRGEWARKYRRLLAREGRWPVHS
jgi:hypothetical protein